MEIQKTKDYTQFTTVMSNREVDGNHVKRLAKSIQRRNLLFIRPILVNDKMQLIDGQHRLQACKEIGAEVYYIKVPQLTKSDIAVLNTAQKNWTRSDFINFYAMEGNENYKQLAAIIDKYYWLKISAILRICCGDAANLREGGIKIRDTKEADKVFGWLRQLEPRFPHVTEASCSVAIFDAIKTAKQFDQFKATATEKTFTKSNTYAAYREKIDKLLK